MTAPGTPRGFWRSLSAFSVRLVLLLLVWWMLTGTHDAWWFGLPLALVAASASLWLTPSAQYRIRLYHVPAFALYFLWHSLLAGLDVAKRTLHPKLPLHPEILHITLNLPPGAPTWWLMLTISLLPGTLSVRLNGQRLLEVHCLDREQDVAGSIQLTERYLARMFGLPLPPRQQQEASC